MMIDMPWNTTNQFVHGYITGKKAGTGKKQKNRERIQSVALYWED